jgi:CHAT domain-containing protein
MTVPDAARCVDEARAAIASGDLATAESSLALGMQRYSENGMFAEAADAMILLALVRKGSAETVERFEVARETARGAAVLAGRARRPDLVFGASYAAADAAYFAAMSCQDKRELEQCSEWLLSAGDDLREALATFEFGLTTEYPTQFLTLTSALTQELMTRHWPTEERRHVDETLRDIALCMDAQLGLDSRFPDPDEHRWVMSTLAGASYRHGSPQVGSARLEILAAEALEDGDLAAFMRFSARQYDGERAAFQRQDDLRALRNSFWDRADDLSARTRSRAGRLWTAQQLDEMSGSMIGDAFDDLKLPDPAEAFRAAESNRARTLLDEIAGVTRDLPDSSVAMTLESQILHLPANDPGTSDEADDEIRLVSRLPLGGLKRAPELADRLARLEQIYTEADAGFLDRVPVTAIEDVIASLAEGEAILEYHIPYDALDPAGLQLMLLVTREGVLTLHLPIHSDDEILSGRFQADGRQPIDSSPLGSLIINTRMSIREGDDEAARARLEALYDGLIGPLARYGIEPESFSRLIIVPHGILHAVPFAALLAPSGRFLAEDVAITLAPSASVWQRLIGRPNTAPGSLLGFADPSLPRSHAALPDARVEIEKIAGLLGSVTTTAHVGDDATEAAFRRNAEQTDLLHFATHGDFPEENVMNMHHILLAPGDGHDGRIHAEEVRAMDLNHVRLAVLSICDGGVYRFGPGDEPYGLMSALLAAGANSVVGPRWPIDDRLGRRLIVEFYGGLLELGPAEALRQASVVALRGGAAIRDWAGFVVVGTGRPFS